MTPRPPGPRPLPDVPGKSRAACSTPPGCRWSDRTWEHTYRSFILLVNFDNVWYFLYTFIYLEVNYNQSSLFSKGSQSKSPTATAAPRHDRELKVHRRRAGRCCNLSFQSLPLWSLLFPDVRRALGLKLYEIWWNIYIYIYIYRERDSFFAPVCCRFCAHSKWLIENH